jgi:hypothetical protein
MLISPRVDLNAASLLKSLQIVSQDEADTCLVEIGGGYRSLCDPQPLRRALSSPPGQTIPAAHPAAVSPSEGGGSHRENPNRLQFIVRPPRDSGSLWRAARRLNKGYDEFQF